MILLVLEVSSLFTIELSKNLGKFDDKAADIDLAEIFLCHIAEGTGRCAEHDHTGSGFCFCHETPLKHWFSFLPRAA